MPRLLRLTAVTALAGLFFAGAAAQAGVLTAATWSQLTPGGYALSRTAAQLGATGTSTGGSLSVALSFPQTAVTFFVPKPGTPGVHQFFSITQGGPQALTANPSMGGATMGVPGSAVIKTAVHNSKGVNQSTFMAGFYTLARIPLNVGVAGQVTSKFVIGGASHSQTVDFYAWTPGTLSFMSLTSLGNPLPSVVAMGSFNLTANGGGTVTLVSPTKIEIQGVYGRNLVSLTTLKLYFVPEPSTSLLIAAGALGLLLWRHRH